MTNKGVRSASSDAVAGFDRIGGRLQPDSASACIGMRRDHLPGPIAIFVAVIGKGLEITGAIAKPGGFAVAQGLAILLLVLICFLAGLLARAAIAPRVINGLEANVLSRCLTGRSARLITLAGLNLVI
jgi:hypothetical protein